MILDIIQLNFITAVVNAIIVVSVIIVYRQLKRTKVNLKGRTALITGGASGIGLATAKAFAEIGMNIVIWDKNEERMKKTRKDIESRLQKGYYLIQQKVDVADSKQIEVAREQLNQKLSEMNQNHVSVIINNAGIVYKHSFQDMDIKEVENTFLVNTISMFSIIHTFFPDLKSQRVSNIVNMSSLISFIPCAHLSSYSSSKAAIRAMTDGLRVELKATNNDHIRVCTICPQFVNTGMFKGSYSNQFLGHRLKNFFFPMNSPEDIAKEIIFAITYERDEIILPRISRIAISFLNLFPHVITDYIFMFIGGSHGMDTFEGHGKEWNHSCRLEGGEKTLNENTIICCSTNSL